MTKANTTKPTAANPTSEKGQAAATAKTEAALRTTKAASRETPDKSFGGRQDGSTTASA